jgi:hypothetical protein
MFNKNYVCLLQRTLIVDDVVTLLGKENQILKEFPSYIMVDLEQRPDDLLVRQVGHSTDMECCCVVVVNSEQQMLFYVAYLMALNARQN